jgi:hypothetical protein
VVSSLAYPNLLGTKRLGCCCCCCCCNHTAYATIKMPGPKGIIVLKSDQRDALACENAALTHAGRFGENEAEELAVKVAKTHGGSTPVKIAAPKPPTGNIL